MPAVAWVILAVAGGASIFRVSDDVGDAIKLAAIAGVIAYVVTR